MFIRWSGRVLVVVGLVLAGWGIAPQPQTRVQTTLWAQGPTMVFHAPLTLRASDTAAAYLEITAADNGSPNQLEATLRFNGLETQPVGTLQFTLDGGQTAHFTWQMAAAGPTQATGALWIHRILPDGSRLAVYTIPLHVRVRTFVGLTGLEARLLGLFALFLAAILFALAHSSTEEKNP